jgi:hypothetical protein
MLRPKSSTPCYVQSHQLHVTDCLAPPRDPATNMPSTNYPLAFTADRGPKSSTPCYVQSHQLHVTSKATNSMFTDCLAPPRDPATNMPSINYPLAFTTNPGPKSSTPYATNLPKVINSMLRRPTLIRSHKLYMSLTCLESLTPCYAAGILVQSHQLHVMPPDLSLKSLTPYYWLSLNNAHPII